jgi:hypothetical protein
MFLPPRIVRELEFKVIKEDWFIYKLKDGSILKIKPVLVRVFETDQVDPEGKKIPVFMGQNIVTVRSPENLKGTPTLPLPPPTDALKLDKEEVEIEEPIYDPQWNFYELENGEKIKTKIVITHVYRIKGKYTETGDPYYVVQSTTVSGSSPEREAESFQMSEHNVYTFWEYGLLSQVRGSMGYDIVLPNFGFQYTRTRPSVQHDSSLTYVLAYYVWPLTFALAHYGWLFRLKSLQIEYQKISTDELTKYLNIDDALIKEELRLLLRSYEIPEEFFGKVETMIRDYIESELKKRDLPVEDWIINPLYKLFVHIAYVMLYV